MSGWAFLENIVTLLMCAAIVLGLRYMGSDWWAVGFVVLINLNSPRKKAKP